jgi:hypothetical protein
MQPGNTSDHQQTFNSYLDHLRSSEVNGRSLPQRVILSSPRAPRADDVGLVGLPFTAAPAIGITRI